MENEGFGYFRLDKRGKVHYFDEIPGERGLWTLCGRHVVRRRLLPAHIEEAKTNLCRACKKVQDNEFWGWEQML